MREMKTRGLFLPHDLGERQRIIDALRLLRKIRDLIGVYF